MIFYFWSLPKFFCVCVSSPHQHFNLHKHTVHLDAPTLRCVCGHARPGHAGVSAGSTADHIVVADQGNQFSTKQTLPKHSGVPPLPSQPVVVVFFCAGVVCPSPWQRSVFPPPTNRK